MRLARKAGKRRRESRRLPVCLPFLGAGAMPGGMPCGGLSPSAGICGTAWLFQHDFPEVADVLPGEAKGEDVVFHLFPEGLPRIFLESGDEFVE